MTSSSHLAMDEEMLKRLAAAGIIWDDVKQDWIPDPAAWGDEA